VSSEKKEKWQDLKARMGDHPNWLHALSEMGDLLFAHDDPSTPAPAAVPDEADPLRQRIAALESELADSKGEVQRLQTFIPDRASEFEQFKLQAQWVASICGTEFEDTRAGFRVRLMDKSAADLLQIVGQQHAALERASQENVRLKHGYEQLDQARQLLEGQLRDTEAERKRLADLVAPPAEGAKVLTFTAPPASPEEKPQEQPPEQPPEAKPESAPEEKPQ
jgi:hypothetical protein